MSLNPEIVRFLHISDPHFSTAGNPLGDQDFKDPLAGTKLRTREESLERTLEELSTLTGSNKISAILLTGDYDFRGASGGMVRLRDMLGNTLGRTSLPPIVVVPGNHDVARGTAPSSPERYKTFLEGWRQDGLNAVTPFLDGVDDIKTIDTTWEEHCLVSASPNSQFIAIPINSCNWSQSKLEARKDIDPKFWNDLAARSVFSDPVEQEKFQNTLRKQLDIMAAVDAALISDIQFTALKKIIHLAEKKAGDGAVKIALIHHHLLPVNSREEHKIYADLINLEKLRQFLRLHGFHILLHGHKHDNAVYVDHIYQEHSNNFDAHEVLVVSGGTIDADGQDACRFIELESLPNAPFCKIRTIPLVAAGGKLSNDQIKELAKRSLWKSRASKAPAIVSGTGIDEVYERACQLFENRKTLNRPVICHIEFDKCGDEEPMRPPMRYPLQPNDVDGTKHDLVRWFKETVEWWQLKSSKSEARIPYIHGTRLYRFGGAKDQIDRIVRLLKNKPMTSKAVAVLLDPIRDFSIEPVENPEHFASFCLVQFKLHNNVLECIAYYRAQEFLKWWPVNVAELRKLQMDVGDQLKSGVTLGGITTIAGDARIEDNVSPTQVAVPLIDQWLDNCPEKIAAMAHAVLWPAHVDASKPDYFADWQRCFNDILASTEIYTSEGIPIAIEGLNHLRLFLTEFASNSHKQHQELIREVKNLLHANEQFCEGKKDAKNFSTWSQTVNSHVQAILKLAGELAGKTPN